MAHLEVHKFIDASPEAVWSVLEDFEHQAEWMVDIRRLAVISEQKRGVGVVLDATSAVFGLPIVRDRIEVTAWDPPRRMEIRRQTPSAGIGRIALQGTGSFALEPEAGGTRLLWVEDVTVPLGVVGEWAWRLLVAPYMRWVFGRSTENLRQLARDAS